MTPLAPVTPMTPFWTRRPLCSGKDRVTGANVFVHTVSLLRKTRLKADRFDNILVCYLRLLIHTDKLFSGDDKTINEAAPEEESEESKALATEEQKKESEAKEESEEDILNFTRVSDLSEEKRVFVLYKQILIHLLKKLESKSTLMEDL